MTSCGTPGSFFVLEVIKEQEIFTEFSTHQCMRH